MIFNEIDLVSFKNINLFSKKVTHKISKQNFKQFIKTAISLENIELTADDKVVVSYLDEVQTYEISILSSSFKYPIIISHVFKEYYSKNNSYKQVDIFVTDEFFVIYKNKILYFSKPNNAYSNDDIVNYINYNYKLSIDNIFNISNDELSKLKTKFLDNIKKNDIPKYICTNTNNSYIYFLAYLFLILSGVFYLLKIYNYDTMNVQSQYNTKKLEELKVEYEDIQKKNKYKNNLTQELVELFNYLKIYNISIVKLKYKKRISALIISKDKKNIYDFISVYDKNIQIKSIKFENKMNKFIVDIQIDL